jgi:HEAT repeat protein
MTIDQTVEEFSIARHDRLRELKDEIIRADAAAIPYLVAAYRSGKIGMWKCFRTILEMKPATYQPVLESANDDSNESVAIIDAIANHRKPLPEAIPIIVRGLESSNWIKVCRCLEAILHVHPLIQVHCPDQLFHFAEATNRLLNLFSHERNNIRESAMRCIALLRPPESDVLARLKEVLEGAYPYEQGCVSTAAIEAIGRYGDDAKHLVPILSDILQHSKDHNVIFRISQALARIGSAATPTIPLLEQAKERVQFAAKSHAKQFKVNINKDVRAIKKSSKSLSSPKPSKGDPYLLDLIARLGTHSDAVVTSANSTSSKARQEMNRLSDSTLVPGIAELFTTKLKRRDYYYLASILGAVTRNSDSTEGRNLLLRLFDEKPARKDDIDALIHAAALCKNRDAYPVIRGYFFADGEHHVMSALDFFKALGDDIAVNDIGVKIQEITEYRLLCIFALSDLGSPKAYPYLMEMAKRDYTSRKKEERQWRYYSIHTLGKLKAVEAVPDLLHMLSDKRYEKSREVIVSTLCELEDEAAFAQVVQMLHQAIDQKKFAQHWWPVLRTIYVNGFEYLQKIGNLKDPAVLAVYERLKLPEFWNCLLKEERFYLDRIYGY